MDNTTCRKLFQQIHNKTGEIIDRYYIGIRPPILKGYHELHIIKGFYNYNKMKIGESIKFTGTTSLTRIQ